MRQLWRTMPPAPWDREFLASGGSRSFGRRLAVADGPEPCAIFIHILISRRKAAALESREMDPPKLTQQFGMSLSRWRWAAGPSNERHLAALGVDQTAPTAMGDGQGSGYSGLSCSTVRMSASTSAASSGILCPLIPVAVASSRIRENSSAAARRRCSRVTNSQKYALASPYPPLATRLATYSPTEVGTEIRISIVKDASEGEPSIFHCNASPPIRQSPPPPRMLGGFIGSSCAGWAASTHSPQSFASGGPGHGWAR